MRVDRVVAEEVLDRLQPLGIEAVSLLGNGSRTPSGPADMVPRREGRTHDRNRPTRQVSHFFSCIQWAVHTWHRGQRDTGSPTGREAQGDGAVVVVRGRESRPHGEGPQVRGWSNWEVAVMATAETALAIHSIHRFFSDGVGE